MVDILDRDIIRGVSILDTSHKGDMFEAVCNRHAIEMEEQDTLMHTQGAIYTNKPPFAIFACDHCMTELGIQAREKSGDAPPLERIKQMIVRKHTSDYFEAWDSGDAPGDWFQYVGEGTMENGRVYFEDIDMENVPEHLKEKQQWFAWEDGDRPT